MSPRIVAGRYELLDRLGSGGMATVWRARDRSLGRLVAVKVLHENLAQDALFVERFRREARNAAGLTHPNVVAVYDTGAETQDGTQVPFIVMEYVEGPSLHQVIRSSGPLPVARAVRVGRQVLQALRHAHARGLVHRDVKPGNVLVADDMVKVTDFGIAKGLEETMALTQTGTLVGTASYIAPEQASGRPATAASDLYAVGCVMFESLAGHPPYVADNAVAVALAHQRSPIPSVRAERPDVPAALDAAIARALAKDPARRFASAADMDAALAATGLDAAPDQAPTLAAAAPTQHVPAGTEVLPTARPVPPNRLGRLFGWAGIVLLALALVWLGLTFLNLLGPDASPTPAPTPAATLEPTPPPTRRPAPTPASPTPSPTPEITPEPTDLQPRTPRPPQTPNLPGFGDESPSPEPLATG